MPTALALAGCTPPEPPPDPGGGGQGDEEAELEPCSTPPRTDWKSFYFEPNRVQPLSPKATVSQLGVNDPKVVDALNLSLAASVRPLKVPKLPGYINARLKTATAKLGQLKKIKDPAEYAKLKGDIFTPLDLDLENLIVGPAFIDEAGGGGNTIDELWRPGNWPEVRPNPFVDLRVRPAACGAYATAAANQARQRVYRNIQLSQVHTEKHCLAAGQGLTISTSQLQPGVDTVAYLYDSATASMLARNDDAVHGAAASFLRYTNATTTTKCVSALVLNARPSIAGTARVTTTVTSGSAERTTNVEVQLRSFPLELNYDDTDIDFEVALTRYTDLPQTPTTLPLALFRGDELVGFDYDSGVGPAARVSRDVLASRIPTRALVLGQSVESRDFTFTGAYLPQGTVDALQTVSPFGNDLYVDPAPEFAEGVFPPSTQPTAPPVGFTPLAPTGRVDLVLNHPNEPDRDTDGISAETEAQLCTCDPHNRGARPAAWYPYCVQRSAHLTTAAPSEPLWFADTDHDGLTDREEIFGVELDQHRAPFPEPEAVFRTIALPVMGADPLHKDLFLELDFNVNPDHPREYTFRSAASPYLDEATGLPVVAPGLPDDEKVFRGEFTRVVDRMFASGAVADLRNPSGLDGIRVHADIGANPILTTAGREEHCRYSCAADAECLARCNVSIDHEQWLYRHRAFGAWGGGGTRVPTTANDLSTEQGRASWAQFCEVAPHYTSLCPPESATAERKLRDLAYESNEFFNRHRMRYFRYGLTSPYGKRGGEANGGGAFGSGLGPYTTTKSWSQVCAAACAPAPPIAKVLS